MSKNVENFRKVESIEKISKISRKKYLNFQTVLKVKFKINFEKNLSYGHGVVVKKVSYTKPNSPFFSKKKPTPKREISKKSDAPKKINDNKHVKLKFFTD